MGETYAPLSDEQYETIKRRNSEFDDSIEIYRRRAYCPEINLEYRFTFSEQKRDIPLTEQATLQCILDPSRGSEEDIRIKHRRDFIICINVVGRAYITDLTVPNDPDGIDDDRVLAAFTEKVACGQFSGLSEGIDHVLNAFGRNVRKNRELYLRQLRLPEDEVQLRLEVYDKLLQMDYDPEKTAQTMMCFLNPFK